MTNPDVLKLLSSGNVLGAMNANLHAPGRDRIKEFFLIGKREKEHQEGALYAGLTLGDFLYDYIRIDPTVVKGVDFARSEDLHSIFNFSMFADRLDEIPDAQLAGNVNQLQGYVAEQLVAHHLEAQGHDVLFPATSNQEGWDILVDGAPFQIKNLDSAEGVNEHLQRFHEIPVIVNAELADHVGHLDNVYVDPLLKHDQVLDLTKESLHFGQELSDFEIPWISLAVSSSAAVRDLYTQQTDIDGALITIFSNTAGRIAVGKLGSITSSMAGLFLFGPAGGIVFSGFGAIVGAYWGRKAATSIRSLLLSDLEMKACDAARDCAALARDAMQSKLHAWQSKQEMLKDAFTAQHLTTVSVGSYMNNRMSQEIAYFRNKSTELEIIADGSSSRDAYDLWSRLTLLCRRAGVHPHHLQDGFKKLKGLLDELIEERRRYRV